MKTIVFIGTQKSGSSREAIKSADSLGYFTVLFTDRSAFLEKRTEFPDVHLIELCNLNNIDEIKKGIKHLQLRAFDIKAIVSFTDPYCYTAALLAEQFGISHFSTEAIGTMEDKLLSRKALLGSPYCPKFMTLDKDSTLSKSDLESILPVIVKSPNSTGSKDVFKTNSYNELIQCRDKLISKYPDTSILIEEFLDGPQYLVETLVYKNKLYIIAIIEQEITFYNGHFIVTGYNVMINPPPSFEEKLRIAVESIIKSHGLESGPCHLEMRYVKDQWKLIEVNPRISGGGMNQLIEIAYGINLVQETLKIPLNQEPELSPKYKVHTFAQYVIISRTGTLQKVTGKSKAYKCPGVKSVYLKPRKGAQLTPPSSMGNRYAFVIATGKNETEAKENARQAAAQIEFWLSPVNSKAEVDGTLIVEKFIDTERLIKCLEEYKSYLLERAMNEASASRHISNLDKYIAWIKSEGGFNYIPLERERILQYKKYLIDNKKYKKSTVNIRLKSLIPFNTFLITQGLQSDTVIDKKDLIKIKKEKRAEENK